MRAAGSLVRWFVRSLARFARLAHFLFGWDSHGMGCGGGDKSGREWVLPIQYTLSHSSSHTSLFL